MFVGVDKDTKTSDDEWFIDGSDEENDGDDSKGPYVPWTPDAKDILSMFAQLEEGKVLELNWKCPGRRPPSPEKGEDDDGEGNVEDMYSDDDIKEEETKAPEISEFDFDDFGVDASTKMTPRRTPGSKSTPRSQKKVASMDNVLNKIRHQQKEKAALKEARRGMSRSPASPARFRLGMTGSPGGGSSPRRVVSSTGTPLRAPVSEDPFSPGSPNVFGKDSKVSQTPAEMPPAPDVPQEAPAAPVATAAPEPVPEQQPSVPSDATTND